MITDSMRDATSLFRGRSRLRNGKTTIALLCQTEGWGGSENHTIALINTFLRSGRRVRMFPLDQKTTGIYRPKLPPAVEVDETLALHEHNDFRLPRAQRVAKSIKADVGLFVKNWFGVGSFARDLALKQIFPKLYAIQHSMPDKMPAKETRLHLGIVPGIGLWWYKKRFPNYLRSLCYDKCICVSRAVRASLIEDCGFPKRKVVTIHNGVDTSLFTPDRTSGLLLRRRLNIPDSAFVFGTVGRLHPIKGYHSLVDYIGKLHAESNMGDVRLIVVGSGSELPALQAAALDRGIEHLIYFPGDSNQPWDVYPAFDCFLMPSLSEGLPLTLLEAMSCSRCVIANSVGGIPEVLNRPGIGWLISAGDGDGFLAAMRECVCAAPQIRQVIGERAREHVTIHFEQSSQLALFNALLD